MKKEQLYKILGDIDESAVKAAENPPARAAKKKAVIAAAAAAACIAAAVGGVLLLSGRNSTQIPSAEPSREESSEADIALDSADIKIYYLDGGEIVSGTEFLPCDPKEIFESWKARNGIGSEVRLIEVRLEDNGTDGEDSVTAWHTVGDSFTLNVTVSVNLKNYFDTLPEDKLLRSLKLTLTEYSEVSPDDFNLTFAQE